MRKAERGEFSALRELKAETKDLLTPLIEVPPIPWDFESEKPAKSINGHLEPIAGKLIGVQDTPTNAASNRMTVHPFF